MSHTPILLSTEPGILEVAGKYIIEGKVIAFPTDTVYGLGAGVFQPAGISRLYEAKGRDQTKAIAVLIGDVDQLHLLTPGLPPPALRLAEKFWPGALTLVVPRNPSLPDEISLYPSIGIRMPDHPFARSLLKATGPLATTSANLSGQSNPQSAADVYSQLDGRIDLIIDGGIVKGGVPSTVVDCSTDSLVILRQGAIPSIDILNTLRDF
jgi:L-threonylcarbamoyladenylate synthase